MSTRELERVGVMGRVAAKELKLTDADASIFDRPLQNQRTQKRPGKWKCETGAISIAVGYRTA